MLDLSNCRCIIFDLDGTILDSTQVWAKVDMDFWAEEEFLYLRSICRRLRHIHLNPVRYILRKV